MAEATESAADRKRSPGYPTIDLKEAIEKVQTLYEEDKVAPTTPEVIAGHWESKTTSSAFMQWLASLKRYGLLVDVPAPGGGKQWKVSPLAVDILLLPDDSPDRPARIKEAALNPKAHQELWKDHGVSLPSDANLIHKLVTTKGYQQNSARDLIAQYKRTLAFAKLSDGDKVGDTGGENGSNNAATPSKPSTAGAVMQTTIHNPPQLPVGNRQDVFSLDEGQIILTWPAGLTEESLPDFKDWIELAVRKIERSIKKTTKDTDIEN